MKKYNLIYILLFLLISSNSNSGIINNEISVNYSKIFKEKILTKEDKLNYQKIFELQEICKWKLANKYIFKIKNKILIGHVFSQRYLHPNCYRSEYIELKNWLKNYNDHPDAKKIYKLAIRRMPAGYKSPLKPIKAIGIKNGTVISKKITKYKSKKKLTKNQIKEKQRLINTIKSRVNSGWPTGAVKTLSQRDVNLLLDQVEIDQQKELIAKGYFLANKNDLAIKYAREALDLSAANVPYAGWTAGLAAWRQKKYELSADFFSTFSISLKDDVWHQSSGSFWAARSYAKINKYEEINYWLNRASKNPSSFYGLLASEILGIEDPINWEVNDLEISNNSDFLDLPSGKRIKALIQVGLPGNLESEIIHINKLLNKDVAIWSLSIAQHLNLAFTQLKVVNKLEQYDINIPDKYYYPTPIWKPKGGFTLQKELIYAFMHQESLFNKNAKSSQGAMGLMQIMPRTAKFITKNKDVKKNNADILKIPDINLEVGQEYIHYLLNLESINKNLIYLTAAYNAGPGNLNKWKNNINYLDDPLFFMESIPSRETRWFIEKVLTKYWIYQNKNKIKSQSLILIANGKSPIY